MWLKLVTTTYEWISITGKTVNVPTQILQLVIFSYENKPVTIFPFVIFTLQHVLKTMYVEKLVKKRVESPTKSCAEENANGFGFPDASVISNFNKR